jgi:crotonobetainyl-CoA:carnitine CoA-transferase CaiB-like acyl-CoA transferase
MVSSSPDASASSPAPSPARPLEGVRVIESSLLEPASLGALLADLGADVVKVEPPGEGDYVRRMAWPIIDGISILHWHCNRGKRSLALDLRKPEAVELYLDLVRGADIVIEGMRAGALARRGLGYEALRAVNPSIVFCSLSGFGSTGPYKDLPSHGIAVDTWGAVAPVERDENGFTYLGDHVSVGTKSAPVWAALGVVSALYRARLTGQGAMIDVAQTDAAAAVNWLKIEGFRAYERPADEVTGNASDNYVRRAPGVAGMKDGVRYQVYETTDGYILFMASEREFWENFCQGIDRMDLFEAHPGEKYADHAVGNLTLRRELRDIFATRSTQDWITFGVEQNTTIAPVHDPHTITTDPQFQDRFPWLPAAEHGTDLMPNPIKFTGEGLAPPSKAPTPGQHTDEVLADFLGYDAAHIATLRESGVIG